MGQLLDYRQRSKGEAALLIVTETKPNEEDRDLAFEHIVELRLDQLVVVAGAIGGGITGGEAGQAFGDPGMGAGPVV